MTASKLKKAAEVDEYKKGNFLESFGAGTAATISAIKELAYKNEHLVFDVESNSQVSQELGERLSDIRLGVVEDIYGCIEKI